MDDEGYVGYRDEVRMYFSAITDSPGSMRLGYTGICKKVAEEDHIMKQLENTAIKE